MCGIAGIAMAPGAPAPSAAMVNALAGALAHRGPDGGGHSVVGRVALVHTRLAIIDVAGRRSAAASRAPATLIANGEIYNYRELSGRDAAGALSRRKAIASRRCICGCGDGACDYARPSCAGMYAIAIHDRAAAQSLTLTRDPFGIKPLYVGGRSLPGRAAAWPSRRSRRRC